MMMDKVRRAVKQPFLFYQQCVCVAQKLQLEPPAPHSSCVERNTEPHLDRTCLLKPPTPQ